MIRVARLAALLVLAASALAVSAQTTAPPMAPAGSGSTSTMDSTSGSSWNAPTPVPTPTPTPTFTPSPTPTPTSTVPPIAQPPPATSDPAGTTTSTPIYMDGGGSGSAWGNAGGSGSGWIDVGWDGSAGWDGDLSNLWDFEPAWGWETPYPPNGTTYHPGRELDNRRSFHFAPKEGVALTGAQLVARGGRANCSHVAWCVHVTFHSSYGLLTDMDAFVLDRYDSVELLDGATFSYATIGDPTGQNAPWQPMPLILGGWTPEERALVRNSSADVQELMQRFNETRRTTWTLFPRSEELDVVLSFKQLFTLLPGYRPGHPSAFNGSTATATDMLESEWGPSDQVLLRLTAELQSGGAGSAMLPRVLNFTGSELLDLDYFSSLVFEDDGDEEDNLSGAITNELALDVVFRRHRYGSGIPWNPAKPSDVCAACDAQVMRHERIARCLAKHVPKEVFHAMYDETMYRDLGATNGTWNASAAEFDDYFDINNGAYALNHVVDACFGLQWLLNGVENGFDDSFSSSSSSSWSSSFWSGSNLDDIKAASSSSGSKFGATGNGDAGDWGELLGFVDALQLTQDTDTGIQCFVKNRCPVGEHYFASAAGRVVVLEHQRAAVAVTFSEPSFTFKLTLRLPGSDEEFMTSTLWSEMSEAELAAEVVAAMPNASDYNLAVDVRFFNNSQLLQLWDEWMADPTTEPPMYDSSWDFGWSDSTSTSGSDTVDPSFASDMGSGSMDWGVPAGRRLASEPGETRPEPAFTVEISFRNVSVAPEVVSVGGMPWWLNKPSQLRLKLAPLNLTQYQYVPPPDHVDLSWTQGVVDDDGTSGDNTDDSDSDSSNTSSPWDICSECQPAYDACDSNTGCQAGIRAFVEEALYPSVFENKEVQMDPGSYDDTAEANRRRFGVDVAFRLRQSAGFFTADGYELFMNLLSCISTAQTGCDLDLPREVKRYEDDSWPAAAPTTLDLVPSRVVFELGQTTDGRAEDVTMRYRDQERVFVWPETSTEELDIDTFHNFVWDVMTTSFDIVEGSWGRSPTPGWVGIYYHTYMKDGSTTGDSGLVYSFEIIFKNGYFLAAEPPRFKPAAAEVYQELERSHWKAIISAYRDPEGEKLWDSSPLLTWPRLASWLHHLGWDPNFRVDLSYGNIDAWQVPICYQCTMKLSSCYWSEGCRSAIRDSVLPTLAAKREAEGLRFHIDFAPEVATWKAESDPTVFYQVLELLECLTRVPCPVGYVRPANQTASLMPTRVKVGPVFWLTASLGAEVEMVLDSSYYSFVALDSSTSAEELREKLYSMTLSYGDFSLTVSLESDSTSVTYRIDGFSSWVPMPTFTVMSVGTQLEVKMVIQADFYLLSEAVEDGAWLSWGLLDSWFGLDLDRYYDSSDGSSGSDGGDSGNSDARNAIAEICPSCISTMERCEADYDCATSSREVLAPMLDQASWNYSAEITDDSRTRVSVNLAPLLLSLESKAFTTREAWSALAAELYCIGAYGCELEPGYYNETEGKYYEPTYLDIVGSTATVLRFRMYADTVVVMWMNGVAHKYTPVAGISLSEAMDNFRYWIMDVVYQDPYYLEIDSEREPMQVVDDTLGLATLGMGMYSVMDDREPVYSLVNPVWMPKFEFVGGSGLDVSSSLPPPEVNVTPWEVKLWSMDRRPNAGRLAALLTFNGTMGSGSGSTWWGSGSSDQGSDGEFCSSCAEQRQSCYDDNECYDALMNKLLPQLSYIYADATSTTDAFVSDMSMQILDGVLMQIPTLAVRRKIVNLLSCSSDASCIQTSSDLKTTGGYANLEITPAMSTFTVGVGEEFIIYNLDGTSFSYYDNGDAGALDDFVEMTMLGGIETSGIKVVSWISDPTADNRREYKIVYYGATDFSLPRLEWPGAPDTSLTYSVESTMQFRFVAPTSDMVGAYSVWFNWLAMADTSSTSSSISSSSSSSSSSSNPTSSSSSSSKPTSSSSFSSGGSTATTDSFSGSGGVSVCAECATSYESCLVDSECSTVLMEHAMPVLQTLYSESTDVPFIFDASSSFLGDVFPIFSSPESRVKLLELLSCSAYSSCVQQSANVGNPGATASMEFVQAFSVFSVDVGTELTIATSLGDQYPYTFDGDTAALSTYVQDMVLGSYTVSGVYVEIMMLDEVIPATYSMSYQGFTGLEAPHLTTNVGESEDSTMKISFTSDTVDIQSVLAPWLQWLGGSATA